MNVTLIYLEKLVSMRLFKQSDLNAKMSKTGVGLPV